jgi:ATP-dependent RNA helicase RhlE
LTFNDFNFNNNLIEGIESIGFKKPSPIQEQTIPKILSGKDLIACAQTGTGKTAAFVLPILNKIIDTPEQERHLNTLIIAPTRELVVQIDQQIEGLGYFTGVSSIAVYGGGDGMVFSQQKKAIEEGVDIIIATPGRLMALIQMGGVNFSKLQHLVLDEADRMLDMGFYDDIVKIISHLPQKRQTVLFSATMPSKIETLARKILHQPELVTIAISKPAEKIWQQVYYVQEHEKLRLVNHILTTQEHQSTIIFASSKDSVKKLDIELGRKKIICKAFHSDLEQKDREAILQEFKARTLPILIGTDILSRGIDVDGIGLVINYNAPHDAEDYVHRIGRTARAEKTGVAITFISERDKRKLADIERMIGKTIEKMPLPNGFSPLDFEKPLENVYDKKNSAKKPFRRRKP